MSKLLYEKQGMIAKIIINRPEKRNALNSAVIHGIVGMSALNQRAIDHKLLQLDGTKTKSKLRESMVPVSQTIS